MTDGENREGSSLRSQWTLALAVMGSVLLIGGTVLVWRQAGEPASDAPPLALPGPWEPPTAPATGTVPPASGSAGASSPEAIAPPPPGGAVDEGADDDDAAPPRTTPPTGAPTTRPTSTRPSGPNLSLDDDTDADGSSKADGTSFNDVRDGNLRTFWSPTGSTGVVSVKWPGTVRLSRIVIRETSGGGTIRAWRVLDHDADRVLASGTGAGEITFAGTTLRKISFEVLSANGTPRVAEFETFAV